MLLLMIYRMVPKFCDSFILSKSSEEDDNLFEVGLDAIGGFDERDTMRGTDPLQVHGNTIRHYVGSRISGKFVVVAICDAEGVQGLSNIESGVFRDRVSSDELGG